MRGFADDLRSMIAALWVGGMWAIGFIVAPVLFATLPDRALAGMLAGRLFSLIAWTGAGCAVYLLAFQLLSLGAGAWRLASFRIVLAMFLLLLIGQFGVQPVMEALREQGLRDRFATWHVVASGLYLLQSLLGAALLALLRRENIRFESNI